MLRRYQLAAVCLSIICFIKPSYAWWATGHAVTAMLATQYMTTATAQSVQKLLNQPIDFPILSNKNRKQPSPRALSIFLNTPDLAATWADDIKPYQWRDIKLHQNCSSLHFIVIPTPLNSLDQCQRALTNRYIQHHLGNKTTINAYNGIRSCIKSLAMSNTTQTEKSVALRYLLHLMGDIHQPLHNSDPYFNEIQSTWGGNKIYFADLTLPEYEGITGKPTSVHTRTEYFIQMHAFFDGMLGMTAQLPETTSLSFEKDALLLWEKNRSTYQDYLVRLAQHIIARQSNHLSDQMTVSLIKWIKDNVSLACRMLANKENIIYQINTRKAQGQPQTVIEASFTYSSKQFMQKYQTALYQQIYLGGIRTAHILNALYDPNNSQAEYVTWIQQIRSDPFIPTLFQLVSPAA